jgi:hypothetical protein
VVRRALSFSLAAAQSVLKRGIDAATRTDKGIFRGGQIIRSLCVHPSQSEQSDLAKIFSGNSTPLARVEKIDRESRF